MKKHSLLGTILSAALITAGSMAMAQSGTGSGTGSSGDSGAGGAAGPRGTAPIQEQSPSTPGGSGAGTMAPSASPTSPSSGSMSSPSTMAPSEDLVGKDVVNAEGDEIGEISAVMGNQVIVEVGGFLGIGAREVAVDWEKITTTGMGDDIKLQTTLTKAELEAMPEYKK